VTRRLTVTIDLPPSTTDRECGKCPFLVWERDGNCRRNKCIAFGEYDLPGPSGRWSDPDRVWRLKVCRESEATDA
jgi:hypothetical protein